MKQIVLAVTAILLLPPVPAAGVVDVLLPHPPVLIDSEDDFASPTSGVTGGSGTREDPYVIEGWRFAATGGSGVKLVGTRSHVVIERVALDSETAAATGTPVCTQPPTLHCQPWAVVVLLGAQNVTVRDVRGPLSARIVDATGSSNVVIEDITMGSMTPLLGVVDVAIAIRESTDVTLRNLHMIGGNQTFAYLVDDRNVTIVDSTFVGGGAGNVVGAGGEHVTVERSSFIGSSFWITARVDDLLVSGNEFRDALRGIRYDGDPLDGNAPKTDAVAVCDNEFLRLGVGIEVNGVYDIQIVGNHFESNGDAAEIGTWVGAWGRLFTGNHVLDSSGYGLRMNGEVHHNAFVANALGVIAYGNWTENWWGTVDGPIATPTRGTATFEPWLEAEPPRAGTCERHAARPAERWFETTHDFAVDGHVAGIFAIDLPAGASYQLEGTIETDSPSAAAMSTSFSYPRADPDARGNGVATLGFGQELVILNEDRLDVEARPAIPGSDHFYGAYGGGHWPTLDATYLAMGSTATVERTTFRLVVRSPGAPLDPSAIHARFTDRVGLASLADFSGNSTEVRVVLGVTASEEGSWSIDIEHGLASIASYGWWLDPPPAPGHFTIEGPGVSRDADEHWMHEAAEGRYTWHIGEIEPTTGRDAGPRVLWADLDLTG